MGQKTRFCKNEPEKLLKTKDLACKMGQNEPKNEAEKSFKFNACWKNEPEQTRQQIVRYVAYRPSIFPSREPACLPADLAASSLASHAAYAPGIPAGPAQKAVSTSN
ncbi:MAG TPA: hypothetical protein VFC10_10960 [Terriglobia bacterium]|nr:hypothetical protein [Terriglobia bacterium]